MYPQPTKCPSCLVTKIGEFKNSLFFILSPWWSQQFLGRNPLINFASSERLGSMNSLWFVNKCCVSSPDNVCIFVCFPVYCPPMIVNNLRTLSNPSLAICALFWYGSASRILDQHWFENQNSSSYLPRKIYSLVNIFHGLYVSFCYKRKDWLGKEKKKPDQNGLSVQLATEFPTVFYFRHCAI